MLALGRGRLFKPARRAVGEGAESLSRLLARMADWAAMVFGGAFQPVLTLIARKRMSLPGFQRLSDRAGFQLRSVHYYEPTYAEADLPAITDRDRDLPGLDLNEAGQIALLSQFGYADELAALPMQPAPGRFGFANKMFGVGDAELYYSFVRHKKPRRIVEIGSGNSTLIALEAIAANTREDPGYRCEVTCVEPFEMPWLESTGVQVIRRRVEHVDTKLFDTLGQDDILFIDSSHVIRPFGDVLHEFQTVIPRLRTGVLIQVHDVFTPRDYPEAWLRADRRLWNEQYLLESFLAFNNRYSVICAANWLKHHHWEALARACPILAQQPAGEPGSFWFSVN